MASTITIPEKSDMVEKWAEIVIKIWLEMIDKLDINDTSQLVNSFENHIYANANNDPVKIQFAYEYYGRFVDMGVGKGIPKEDAGNPFFKRQPKPWFTQTFLIEVRKLSELLAANYANSGVLTITRNIKDNADLQMERRMGV